MHAFEPDPLSFLSLAERFAEEPRVAAYEQSFGVQGSQGPDCIAVVAGAGEAQHADPWLRARHAGGSGSSIS